MMVAAGAQNGDSRGRFQDDDHMPRRTLDPLLSHR